MPFEELDKKIREAAESHHPPYDEKAWEKMDQLLDKHMPVEKKKRRRVIFWILPLLLAGTATYFLLKKPADTEKQKAISASGNQQQLQPGISHPNEKNTETISKPLTEVPNEKNNSSATGTPPKVIGEKTEPEPFSVPTGTIVQQKPAVSKNITIDKRHKNNPGKTTKKPLKKNSVIISQPSLPAAEKNATSGSLLQPDITEITPVNPAPTQASRGPVSKPENPVQQNTETKTIPNPEMVKPDTTKPMQNTDPITKKNKTKKNRKENGFYFSLSAGPDISAVGLDNPGKLRGVYGIGMGYSFSKRLSVQTGFYSARKVYNANPDDYHPPANWWAYFPKLEKIEADCKVYEIPLLITYNFAHTRKSNWFGTVGLSSYLMKKESYEYYYKTWGGQPASRNWVYNNEFKHYFNVVTIGGGYTHRISPVISVSVNPYFKAPLKGVGFGKVKLNSAGLLFTAGFSPFTKK
jgi:hypothetical protein